MRIGTTNLQRIRQGTRRADCCFEALSGLNVDLLIVTEPGPGFRARFPKLVVSPERRTDGEREEAWVAIVGNGIDSIEVSLEIEYKHLAVAYRTVLDGRQTIIYGSVLPWLSARTHAPDVYGNEYRTFVEVFDKALGEQANDIERLRARCPADALIWAGDFNHTLDGRPLSRQASSMLAVAIDELGHIAVNKKSPHRKEGLSALNLICVEKSWTPFQVEFFDPVFNNRTLSDHSWYVISVSTP